ncbi:MAG: hypothetical protein WEA04_01025 [Candidatus Andersenbacteria bacterium]
MTAIGGKSLISLSIALTALVFLSGDALAHPGRTDSSGGHNCYTRCAYWGVSGYHYHGGYSAPSYSTPSVAYTPPAPTPAPLFTSTEEYDFSSAVSSHKTAKQNITYWRSSASTSYYSSDYYNSLADGYEADVKEYEQTFLKTFNKAFKHVFSRTPDTKEIDFWMGRIKRGEITSTDALLQKMGFQKAKGLTMPGHPIGSVMGATTGDTFTNAEVPVVVARLFKEVYDRNISPSESTYWKNRARTDKKTISAIKGAMAYHKAHNINH